MQDHIDRSTALMDQMLHKLILVSEIDGRTSTTEKIEVLNFCNAILADRMTETQKSESGLQVEISAIYEGEGDLAEAELLVSAFAQAHASDLPRTYVVDLALNPDLGWFMLEFNSAWGAGLNGCDPQKVLHCIAAATAKT